MTTFSITNTTGRARDTLIKIDGVSVAPGCQGVTVRASVMDPEVCDVELAPVVFEGERNGRVVVRMTPQAHSLLVSQGWTPPVSERE